MAPADVPLRTFLHELLVRYEDDAVMRLIVGADDAAAALPASPT